MPPKLRSIGCGRNRAPPRPDQSPRCHALGRPWSAPMKWSIRWDVPMGESETGQACETSRKRAKAKWPRMAVSVQAWFVRPSGLCFIEVRVKAKRNGCFQRCHWESLALGPSVYATAGRDPYKFSWLRRALGRRRRRFRCPDLLRRTRRHGQRRSCLGASGRCGCFALCWTFDGGLRL